MKAIVVRQPWASLIALGHKTIETRPGPPNGPMRPEGVRGLPGCRIEQGERIAIVAGASKAGVDEAGMEPWEPLMSADGSWTLAEPIALGAVVSTVAVADAVQVMQSGSARGRSYLWHAPDDGPMAHQQGGLWLIGSGPVNQGRPTLVAEEEPLGDFTPGRWGWLLTDIHRTEPIPCKGRQGVFELPADVAERLL